MNLNVLCAIFKRNLVSYFSNPTGYVFICVFVLLSSFAAFWPNEFFNANLANLDQLNKYLPYIMLVFIPAITMSMWAEEKRQGTDELLLTIPATDLDVVLGKFFAALAIFSVALAFSMFSNFCVLSQLGYPDLGLLIGTYIGYWMVGMAMISIGMVASFLTGNLTVGFVLGAIFNAPLAFSGMAEVIIPQPALANAVRQWSLAGRFYDFERGVISLSSVSYFLMITMVMLYLAIVLIGRRHWVGGRDGNSMLPHYVLRTISLLVLAFGVNLLFSYHDLVRADITSEQLSSLSPDTRKLIKNLDAKYPVVIEAYISPQVPSEYVQTRLNLLSTLQELNALGDGKIQVNTHILENFSDEAVLAEQKYGIKPQSVMSRSRGATTTENIYLAAAFSCGLEKVVLPFIDKGVPAEYELVRSICTVAQQKRKRIGVIKTDAQLFGGFDPGSMGMSSDQAIINELRKQYEVVEVDASQPIGEQYDALLAVQPSSLNPQQMANFVNAVKSGQPTAIFEDPFPVPGFWQNVPGTAQPRQARQNNPFMMMGQLPQQPKGDINELWKVLGVDLAGEEIIWQDYNPMPKAQAFVQPEWVFVDSGSGNDRPFSPKNEISAGLQQVLFLYPGAVRKLNASDLEFTELAITGQRTGTIEFRDIMSAGRSGGMPDLSFSRVPTQEKYVMAVHIRSKKAATDEAATDAAPVKAAAPATPEPTAPPDDQAQLPTADSGEVCADEAEETPAADVATEAPAANAAAPAKPKRDGINVVLVADIDCLVSDFFAIRSRGNSDDDEVEWNFDNVTFLLNTLDVLAEDDRFLDIRKRRRPHRTLENVDARTEVARLNASKEREKYNEMFEAAQAEEQNKFGERIAQIEKRKDLDPNAKQIQMVMARRDGQRRLDIRVTQLQQERDRQIDKIERDLALEIRNVQDSYKLWAVILPPLPPLLLALFVFFHRRQQEREGVSRSRLR